MDVDRLSTGEKIAGVSAILLFIFMFFDWFTVSASNEFVSVSVGGSAWDALDVIPIILLVAIVAAIGVAVVRLTDADFEPELSMNAVVSILGIVSVLLILYRIVNPPDADFSGISVDPALGIFLGLIAAAGIAYGGYRAMQEEGASFGDVGDRLSSGRGDRGGPGASPPPPPPPSS
jgi:uncharacterized membrane protein YhaH (DUF805 family)